MSDTQTFASYRAGLGLTLSEMAEALGLKPSSKGWLSEIENGVKPASIRLALRIERHSSGKVPAASLCPELADEHALSPTDAAAPVEPDPAAPVALEKSGVSQ